MGEDIRSYKRNEIQKSLVHNEEAYALICKTLGEEHSDALGSLNSLAVIYVKLGEYKNGRIIPHHHFFSAFGKEFINQINLSCESCECVKYIKGEGFEVDAENGWCVVCVEGIPLGGGKVVDGYLKNHYPKGLRLMGD
jgi:NOL1/NOP2/fmu family ribosome biogenesis protein